MRAVVGSLPRWECSEGTCEQKPPPQAEEPCLPPRVASASEPPVAQLVLCWGVCDSCLGKGPANPAASASRVGSGAAPSSRAAGSGHPSFPAARWCSEPGDSLLSKVSPPSSLGMRNFQLSSFAGSRDRHLREMCLSPASSTPPHTSHLRSQKLLLSRHIQQSLFEAGWGV